MIKFKMLRTEPEETEESAPSITMSVFEFAVEKFCDFVTYKRNYLELIFAFRPTLELDIIIDLGWIKLHERYERTASGFRMSDIRAKR